MTRIFVVFSISITLVMLYARKKYQYCEIKWVAQGVISVGTAT
jgi:hypothetical protein